MVGMALLLVTLTFTLPDSTAYWTGQGDSIEVFCDRAGVPLADIWDARLYAYSLAGGPYRLIDQHDARGREGWPDSFQADPGPGGWYSVTTTRRDSNGILRESCYSSPVYVPGSQVTGVGDDRVQPDPIVERRTYNVHGRVVLEMKASGIYFERMRHRSGRIEKRTVLYLWGSKLPLTRIVQ